MSSYRNLFSRELCHNTIFIFPARSVSFLIRHLWHQRFFVAARFFRGRNSMRRSLCSFVSAHSRFAYSAVKRLQWYYRKSCFHQRFPDQPYEQRASCKGESLSAIVQEKFSLYTYKNILSPILSPHKNAQGIRTAAYYSRIDRFIWSPWKRARRSTETEYLMNFEAARGSIYTNTSTFRGYITYIRST